MLCRKTRASASRVAGCDTDSSRSRPNFILGASGRTLASISRKDAVHPVPQVLPRPALLVNVGVDDQIVLGWPTRTATCPTSSPSTDMLTRPEPRWKHAVHADEAD